MTMKRDDHEESEMRDTQRKNNVTELLKYVWLTRWRQTHDDDGRWQKP